MHRSGLVGYGSCHIMSCNISYVVYVPAYHGLCCTSFFVLGFHFFVVCECVHRWHSIPVPSWRPGGGCRRKHGFEFVYIDVYLGPGTGRPGRDVQFHVHVQLPVRQGDISWPYHYPYPGPCRWRTGSMTPLGNAQQPPPANYTSEYLHWRTMLRNSSLLNTSLMLAS